MSTSRLNLDFQSAGNSARLLGPSLLAAGLVACVSFYLAYRQGANEMEGLELRLTSLESAANGSSAPGDDPSIAAARETALSLATPWGRLLDDLEAASRDVGLSVTLLEVEPDREHGKVRVLAESRSLVAALAYLERLQKSATLANPLLQSHEVRAELAERPVRVEIVADWRAKT
jgi:hypothetical protein